MLASAKADPRTRQANKEALLTLGVYGIYFAWWYYFAYIFPDKDPENYSYIWGLPAWFFYSCIAGYFGISLLLWLVIHFFFKDMPLDDLPAEALEEADTMAASGVASGDKLLTASTSGPAPASGASSAQAQDSAPSATAQASGSAISQPVLGPAPASGAFNTQAQDSAPQRGR